MQSPKKAASDKVKLGVSSCLIGERVRWDGNHKRNAYLSDYLGSFAEWFSVCPEFEVGMGVPRETVHLLGKKDPHMVGTQSGKDWTQSMNRFSKNKVKEIEKLGLDGFILKRSSPSCGLGNVVYKTKTGQSAGRGNGLFAEALLRELPDLPVEDEGRLSDPHIRENFIVRVFAFRRLKTFFSSSPRAKDLIGFHAAHKYLLLAHSQKHYRILGKLLSDLKNTDWPRIKASYQQIFMEALRLKSTRKKNINVLEHMLGFFKDILDSEDRNDLYQVIRDYQKEMVPLIVPITLFQHFVKKHNVKYLQEQVYLNPHPKELMLRNHV